VIERLYDRAFASRNENGLRILVEEDPQSRSVSVGIWIGVGSRDDPKPCAGLAHFIEHLAFKGTATRDAADISREIDSVGGHLNAATGRESTVFYADVPAEGLDVALDILTDLVQRPAFAPEKIDLERAVVLDEIRGHEDDPESVAFDRFIRGVWNDGHALSRPVLGSRADIEGVDAETIRTYHRNVFLPERMVVAASGAVDAKAFIGAISTRFEATAGNGQAAEIRKAPSFQAIRNHHERPTSQTHIYLALPGPKADDAKRYELEVANVALGDGTSSRLFRAVREERGLAYGVGSTVLRYTDAGLWMLYAATASNQAPQVQSILEGEVARLLDDPPSDAEVTLAKARLRGLYILGMESNANRAMRLGTAAITDREIRAHDAVLKKLDGVTTADVHAVIRRFSDPAKLHVTTVGAKPAS